MGIVFSLINVYSSLFEIDKSVLQPYLSISKMCFSLIMYSTGITLYVKSFFEK